MDKAFLEHLAHVKDLVSADSISRADLIWMLAQATYTAPVKRNNEVAAALSNIRSRVASGDNMRKLRNALESSGQKFNWNHPDDGEVFADDA